MELVNQGRVTFHRGKEVFKENIGIVFGTINGYVLLEITGVRCIQWVFFYVLGVSKNLPLD